MERRKFIGVLGAAPVAAYVLSKGDTLSAEGQNDGFAAGEIGSRDACIEVNLDHIGHNLAQIRKRVRVPVMPVVKANAYGHGLIEVSRFLEGQGVQGLMVGKLDEAVRQRAAGIKVKILNFGPFGPSDCAEIVERDICQTITSEDAFYLDEAASKAQKQAAVDLHIDTGMNRAGVPWEKALDLIVKLSTRSHIKIEGVSTTLTEDPEFDREQIKKLVDISQVAKEKGISLGLRHAASSDGIMASPELILDMVRPGIMIYGYYANSKTQKEDALGLRPALRLLGSVTYTKELAPGESLSYHRALKAQARMRIATVGLGYSDGYPTQIVGKGSVAIRGKKVPVVAAVTANHLMIDLVNDPDIKMGDEVVLIDNQKDSGLTADIIADWSGISDYRLLIGLNPLLPRTYKAKSEM